jgi:hypothetical protein
MVSEKAAGTAQRLVLVPDTDDWRSVWSRYHMWIGGAITAVFVAICYGFVLRLPFFYDDLPIMTWLTRHGWADIWKLSSENAYYRPLAFTIYKAGQLFPLGTRQIVLHTGSVFIHWLNTILIISVVRICDRNSGRAVLAGILYAVYPFLFLAIPWVTALSHPLVTMLTLLATYAALRAVRDEDTRWWGVSLPATALAPFAHESGVMCGAIVGGVVIIQYGVHLRRRHIIGICAGGVISVGAVLLRWVIPGVGPVGFAGLRDWPQNMAYFLHGLLYPIAPIIGWLVNQQGWHDLTLVGVTAVLFFVLLVWLARRSHDRRWMTRNLWWWACASLPALASLTYGELFTSPRLYTLAAAGVAMLWAGIISELGHAARDVWGSRMVWGLLAGVIVLQNIVFLRHQRALFISLDYVYQQVLAAAEDKANAPVGFVNVPAWLAWRTKTYALISEGVTFTPDYSNVSEFIEVNIGSRAVDNVMYTPVLEETEHVVRGFLGAGLEWEQMRRFAADHRTVWLASPKKGRFEVEQVGTLTVDAASLVSEPLAWFENGVVIESATVQEMSDGDWALTLVWLAPGPLDVNIFVHVRDADQNVVTQADGPALGGMVPVWLWQSGDRIYDVRHITLPEGAGPYLVQVGLYDAQGRYAAYQGATRFQDDAATVATIVP